MFGCVHWPIASIRCDAATHPESEANRTRQRPSPKVENVKVFGSSANRLQMSASQGERTSKKGATDFYRAYVGPQLLFGSQLRDGGIDRFASDADDLDLVVDSEFLTDRGLSQIGLPMHKACGRISGLDRQKHHRGRIVARAVPKIGRDRGRTDQDQSCQHRFVCKVLVRMRIRTRSRCCRRHTSRCPRRARASSRSIRSPFRAQP